jgi:FixJ family two-component response regulator
MSPNFSARANPVVVHIIEDDEPSRIASSRLLRQAGYTVRVYARQQETRARYNRLTSRERVVFAHLISGQLNKQVGFDLGIAERAIRIHRRRVLQKMEADSIADLVRMAADLQVAAAGKVR